MDRQMMSSRDIRSVGYDKNESTLEIELANGVLYRYKMVGEEIYEALVNSNNSDEYFHEMIEENYPKLKIV
ncbi:KTSC domain-containing protein [Candidatus Woesearchaeota archaeon]|nr:KTSC domain-containing protein [Candidatus Woesearchaeota archaeon]